MGSITVEELKARLDRGEDLFVLDVREREEWDHCRLPGATLIPLGEIQQRFGELDRDREIVVQRLSEKLTDEQWRRKFDSRKPSGNQGVTNFRRLPYPPFRTASQCHHGVRSQYAIAFLARQGFTKLLNLNGGIHAWALRIDPAMPRY